MSFRVILDGWTLDIEDGNVFRIEGDTVTITREAPQEAPRAATLEPRPIPAPRRPVVTLPSPRRSIGSGYPRPAEGQTLYDKNPGTTAEAWARVVAILTERGETPAKNLSQFTIPNPTRNKYERTKFMTTLLAEMVEAGTIQRTRIAGRTFFYNLTATIEG